MSLTAPDIDVEQLASLRLARLRGVLVESGIDMAVLTNPVSIRYASEFHGYATFQSRIPTAYLLVPAEGPVTLTNGYGAGLNTIQQTRIGPSVTTFDAGLDLSKAAQQLAQVLAGTLAELGLSPTATIGVERLTPSAHESMQRAGLRIVDAEPAIELARSRKLDGELVAIKHAIDVAELAMQRMADALEPGITENELWSILHQTNIAHGGHWVDGRMLSSGPRTNPWYQEASNRSIERGELVAFDTDMIGPNGYCADISRTFVCGAELTTSQTELYRRAVAEITHNTSLLAVGASFSELSHAAYQHPPEFVANRYACAFHGVGMTDEYPKIPYPQDWDRIGYHGELEDGVVLSVESYVGEEGGSEGVKLEQMVQVTGAGAVPLSSYPLWSEALA